MTSLHRNPAFLGRIRHGSGRRISECGVTGMEIAPHEAKARLSELVAAARSGERVIITRHGRPAVELVCCGRPGGIDFDRLDAARRRLGLEADAEQ